MHNRQEQKNHTATPTRWHSAIKTKPGPGQPGSWNSGGAKQPNQLPPKEPEAPPATQTHQQQNTRATKQPGGAKHTRSKTADHRTTTQQTADRATQPRHQTRETKHTQHTRDTRQPTHHTHTNQTPNTQRHQTPPHHTTKHHRRTEPQRHSNRKKTEKHTATTKKTPCRHQRGEEKHQVVPHRQWKCDTHNSGGGTTQREEAQKAGGGTQTTQTTANKLQKHSKNTRKRKAKAMFPNSKSSLTKKLTTAKRYASCGYPLAEIFQNQKASDDIMSTLGLQSSRKRIYRGWYNIDFRLYM